MCSIHILHLLARNCSATKCIKTCFIGIKAHAHTHVIFVIFFTQGMQHLKRNKVYLQTKRKHLCGGKNFSETAFYF